MYVGATNRVYQLTGDLRVEQIVDTGPRLDNAMCPPPTSECQCFGPNCAQSQKSLTHAVNRALVVDRRRRRLLVCSSLFQGHCDWHDLANITLTEPPIWQMVVPNDRRSSVVMFIAPGPPNPASTDVLYVAATRSTVGLPAYRDIVPSVCIRNLHDLGLVSDDILTPSRLDVEVQQRDVFRVEFISGFASMGFSYFLAVQRASAVADADHYVTHIARVCQNDRSMTSYVEIPLHCRAAASGRHFDVLTAAYLVHPGADLSRSLGLSDAKPVTDLEHTLVAVFADRRVPEGPSTPEDLAPPDAALCVFPMTDIRREFTTTTQSCFRGNGSTGPDHYVQPKTCYKTVSHFDLSLFLPRDAMHKCGLCFRAVSVRPSVRHIRLSCRNKYTYSQSFFTIG